jgi:hypothetical protein
VVGAPNEEDFDSLDGDDPFDDDEYRPTQRMDMVDIRAQILAKEASTAAATSVVRGRTDSDLPTLVAEEMSDDDQAEIARRIAAAQAQIPAAPPIPRPDAIRPPQHSDTISTVQESPVFRTRALGESVDDGAETREAGQLPAVAPSDVRRYRIGNDSEEDIPTAAEGDREPDTLPADGAIADTDRAPGDDDENVPTPKKKGMSLDMVEAAVLRAKEMTRRKRELGGDSRPSSPDCDDETLTEELLKDDDTVTKTGPTKTTPLPATPLPATPNRHLPAARTLMSEGGSLGGLDDDDIADEVTDEEIATVVREAVPEALIEELSRPRPHHGIERRKISPAKNAALEDFDDEEKPTRVPAPHSAGPATQPLPDLTTQPLPIMTARAVAPPASAGAPARAAPGFVSQPGPDPDLEALLMQMKTERRLSALGTLLVIVTLTAGAALLLWLMT